MIERPSSRTRTSVLAVTSEGARERRDEVTTEEPLEIRLETRSSARAARRAVSVPERSTRRQTVAVTMRTPGSDFELAVGFLVAEGILSQVDLLERVAYCTDKDAGEDQRFNIVTVTTAEPAPDLPELHRHFYTSSACGVCGKASLDALSLKGMKPQRGSGRAESATISDLPQSLRASQKLFEATGGLHAAGLFTFDGEPVAVREDVGRHNAVDKVLGWAFLERRLPLDRHILMVSGRTSFEIVQKGLAAGLQMICSVSAPSSLAIDVAREFGITLIGFVREDRFNVYTHPDRVLMPSPSDA